MVVQANKHKTELEFDIGDMVNLKLQTYHQSLVVARKVPKLTAKYYGP